MIKIINKVLGRFNLHITKQDDKDKWREIIYSKGYKNAILNSAGNDPISEKNLPLVFNVQVPKEHYNYFVEGYMEGYYDGQQAINTARNLLIKFINHRNLT